MEGFLGFLSVILAFMYWGKRGDYEDLRSKVGSIDAYKITTQIDVERHRKWNMEMLKEKEESVDQKQKLLQQFLNAKISDFPVVATIIADYETAKDAHIAHMLEIKKRRALKASKEVRTIRAEKRALIQENKAYKWELEYIRNLLPWLSDLEDEPIEPTTSYENPDYKDSDAAGYWLTPEEYQKRPETEK